MAPIPLPSNSNSNNYNNISKLSPSLPHFVLPALEFSTKKKKIALKKKAQCKNQKSLGQGQTTRTVSSIVLNSPFKANTRFLPQGAHVSYHPRMKSLVVLRYPYHHNVMVSFRVKACYRTRNGS